MRASISQSAPHLCSRTSRFLQASWTCVPTAILAGREWSDRRSVIAPTVQTSLQLPSQSLTVASNQFRELALHSRLAQAGHQLLVEVEVVLRQQDGARKVVRDHQVAQEGTAVTLANRTAATGVDRRGVQAELLQLEIQHAF